MNARELRAWQWQGYARYHQHRTNLLLHIVAVPLFMLASVLLVVGALRLSPSLVLAGGLGILLSIGIQGRGHRLELVPPEPFSGAANFIARLVTEQWVTFPRFVLSGGWWRNLSRSAGR
jgi:Protein of unknown function (DUF962)